MGKQQQKHERCLNLRKIHDINMAVVAEMGSNAFFAGMEVSTHLLLDMPFPNAHERRTSPALYVASSVTSVWGRQ